MSAICLVHAIGVFLLFPALHLADLHDQPGPKAHARAENKTGVLRTSNEEARHTPQTFGLATCCAGSRLPDFPEPSSPPRKTRDENESRRGRRSNGLLPGDDPSEPLQLPSSSRVIGPYFESNRTSITVSARAGQIVMFDCPVALLQGRTVSWLRKRNDSVQLLTVGNATYSSDSRLGLHFRYPNNWRLRISKVNKSDEGDYECQLSTHPTKALSFHLRVTAPAVAILDENDQLITERHYKVDSSLHLTCRASHLDKPGEHLSWFKGDRILPGGDTRIKVKQWKNQTNDEPAASAFLSVLSVRKGDSGTYSCRTSQAQSTIIVHVLNEKLPAAVQHENSANVLSVCHRDSLLVLLFTSVFMLLISPT